MKTLHGYALLTEVENTFEAHLIVGALKGAGIHVHVNEDLLMDEFTMALKMIGVHRVRLWVPASQLDAAREALGELEAARAEARAAEDPVDEAS